MTIAIEKAGARLYFTGNTFPIKDRIKSLGGHWDGDRRQWWVGTKKADDAAQLVESLSAPVMVPTRESERLADSVGLRADTPAGIVADKLLDEGRDAEAARVAASKPKQEPDDIRLTAKGTYKGRAYYVGSAVRDGGSKVRLLTLPDAKGDFLDFWADRSAVTLTQRYEPRRKWNGRRGSASAEIEIHQTLSGIASFIARQRRNEGTGRERMQCQECDSWYTASEGCQDCGGC